MKKIFAFFLPQFHEIEENNKWWGKGFTEWVNVKNAKPMFKNHKQPKVPLNGYYNLLKKETVINQTNIMHQYGIDGLIYYHYYFKGKKLLEKPAENLLKWKDIDQNFFFCWANHSWKKTWNGTMEILQEQTYGLQKEWEEHFNYLLPFFKDSRYEKVNNKPLFMFFLSDFKEKEEMILLFDKLCKENGFNGIQIIETISDITYDRKVSNKMHEKLYFYREPSYCVSLYFEKIKYKPIRFVKKIKKIICQKFSINRFVRVIKGDTLLKIGMKNICSFSNIIHGMFFEWDNTPRHKNRGYIISPISKSMFFEYMKRIENEKYLFINAWNEWAEGMILEPTMENGYKYLEWIKEWRDKNEQ